MALHWDKLFELARGEGREENREIARLGRRFEQGDADASELLELSRLLLRANERKRAEEVLLALLDSPDAGDFIVRETCLLLEKMGLVRDGRPTWAAMIAFGDRPPMQAKVRCGKIRGTHTIVDAFEVDTPLLDQVDEVMAYVRRVFQLSYELTGQARRTEVWEYPLEAVREAVTNAVCHRDYTSSAEVLIKIYDDELVIWNPGSLPLGMTMDMLMDPKHQSVPRNRQIAMLFYDVELIERYGSGIGRILAECDRLQVPRPEFNEQEHGFQVVFRKDVYHEENLRAMGLTERQVKGVLLVKETGAITNREYRELNDVSAETSRTELGDLVGKGVLERRGKGRSVHYSFPRVGD